MKSQAEIINGEHYAVILTETRTIHHEGDERSRTNPGRGYPAWSESIDTIKYIAFESVNDVADWVKHRSIGSNSNYRIIKAVPMRATTSVSVYIG